MNSATQITVGELVARFLETCGVKAAFGVISIHNMPILDAFHRRQKLRFVSARGEAGACNMADAYARVTGVLGACVTSTGTGCGNAAGAMVEAYTAGTAMLHLTGQIESEFLDRDLGYIHEHPAQLAMLKSVGKGAFRIHSPDTALATLIEAVRLAQTPPCGPVSIEIPIDVQKAMMSLPAFIGPDAIEPKTPGHAEIEAMAQQLRLAKRPLLWVGGGARHASAAVKRFVDMGWAVISSVQGRGILDEDHPSSLGSFNLQPATERFYGTVDAMLAVGTRLRSNETLGYKLGLPTNLYRIDVEPQSEHKAYVSKGFVCGDASLSLDALADLLEGQMAIDPELAQDVRDTRAELNVSVNNAIGNYVALKEGVTNVFGQDLWWVRDITLSNTSWGNRAPNLNHPRAGVHALGGGIGQGLAMAIGVAVANAEHGLQRQTVAMCGDGGFMLNLGELACAAQEKANFVCLVMNDQRYGVIRNIQDAIYGGRHAYVDLHTPDFAQLCASLQVSHYKSSDPEQIEDVLRLATKHRGPVIVEIDMNAWGPFTQKFAGPPTR